MSRVNPWLWFGLGAAGIMWVATRAKAQSVTGSAQLTASAPTLSTPGVLPAALATSSAQVSVAADLWSTLQPVAPIDSGFIHFPTGTQAAASLLGAGNTRMDGNGNYYVLWAGQVYQLGNQDSSGNWPAMLANAS